MLKFLRSLVARTESVSAPGESRSTAPSTVAISGAEPFRLADHMSSESGFPRVNWNAVTDWVETLDTSLQSQVWGEVEVAWLLHLRDHLGLSFRVEHRDEALLLSSLEANVAQSTLDFMTKSVSRIHRVLEGVAVSPQWGHDVLVVFDDDDTYYRYVSHFYEEAGEFARSGGMFVNDGCSHFVTVKSDLRSVEPTIVHELTHSFLGHLPLPAWLNEGLAVNTERRLTPPLGPDHLTPAQMHAKHQSFWRPEEIQQFWSGKSWLRPDDANLLSYDLARILVEQFATDWPAFRNFVLAANIDDSGSAAAREHLSIDLGAAVCAVLELEPTDAWKPDPSTWSELPERGGFRDDA